MANEFGGRVFGEVQVNFLAFLALNPHILISKLEPLKCLEKRAMKSTKQGLEGRETIQAGSSGLQYERLFRYTLGRHQGGLDLQNWGAPFLPEMFPNPPLEQALSAKFGTKMGRPKFADPPPYRSNRPILCCLKTCAVLLVSVPEKQFQRFRFYFRFLDSSN